MITRSKLLKDGMNIVNYLREYADELESTLKELENLTKAEAREKVYDLQEKYRIRHIELM